LELVFTGQRESVRAIAVGVGTKPGRTNLAGVTFSRFDIAGAAACELVLVTGYERNDHDEA
jgi:hypothetical protein